MKLDIFDFVNIGVKHLYHITTKENLDSILKNGLLSKLQLSKLDISPRNISNPSVQSRREDKNVRIYLSHVPLYFNKITPMLYVQKPIHSSVVIIAFDILKLATYQKNNWEQSYFVVRNLAISDIKPLDDSRKLYEHPMIIFSEIGWQTDEGQDLYKSQAQCEFLFYNLIQIQTISKLIVNNPLLKMEIEQIIKNNSINFDIPIEIGIFDLPGNRLPKQNLEEKYNNEINRLSQAHKQRQKKDEKDAEKKVKIVSGNIKNIRNNIDTIIGKLDLSDKEKKDLKIVIRIEAERLYDSKYKDINDGKESKQIKILKIQKKLLQKYINNRS